VIAVALESSTWPLVPVQMLSSKCHCAMAVPTSGISARVAPTFGALTDEVELDTWVPVAVEAVISP